MAIPFKLRYEASKLNRERADAFEAALVALAEQHGFPVSEFRIEETREPDRYPEITVVFVQHPRSEQ